MKLTVEFTEEMLKELEINTRNVSWPEIVVYLKEHVKATIEEAVTNIEFDSYQPCAECGEQFHPDTLDYVEDERYCEYCIENARESESNKRDREREYFRNAI